MKVIHKKPGAGKTMQLMLWLASNPHRLLITFNDREADRLRREYDGVETQIMSWHDYQEKMSWLQHDTEIAVDNADMILSQLCRHNINLISLTKDK